MLIDSGHLLPSDLMASARFRGHDMNTSKVNEWLQIAASLGVLIGLLVVAYEIRQNTSVATTEHSRATFSMWLDLSSMELESDVGRAVIKAIEDPDNLSPEDQFKIDSWLNAIASIYEYNNQAEEIGIGPSLKAYIGEDARYYFASRYARQWFERNRRWMNPEAAEIIAQTIADTPIPSTWEDAVDRNSDPDRN